MKPLIGITLDHLAPGIDPEHPHGRYQLGPSMGQAVARAGGVPVLLTPDPALAADYVRSLDGFALSGGLDPDTTAFGEPMHPSARKMDPLRQAFETALLHELAKRAETPVLGVCLGMQMMALHAGGRLNQYMPETHDRPEAHQKGASHPLKITVDDSVLRLSDVEPGEAICSSHQQAVSDPGKLRVVAVADDDTIEAVDGKPVFGDRFYLGVQWHPERGGDGPINLGLFRKLVAAARAST